jgi:hypothetical protein
MTYQSGSMDRDRRISRAGNPRARTHGSGFATSPEASWQNGSTSASAPWTHSADRHCGHVQLAHEPDCGAHAVRGHVVYLRSAPLHRETETDAERINSFSFYDVGKAFREIEPASETAPSLALPCISCGRRPLSPAKRGAQIELAGIDVSRPCMRLDHTKRTRAPSSLIGFFFFGSSQLSKLI